MKRFPFSGRALADQPANIQQTAALVKQLADANLIDILKAAQTIAHEAPALQSGLILASPDFQWK